VLYNPNLEYRWFLLPSLVAIITIDCLMVTALSLAREREEGTFDQLLVSPLTPAYIMAGKAIPGILVAMLQGTIIAAAAVFAYGVPLGGCVWLLCLSMFCYGLSLAGFGLFISAICSNQQQAFLGVFSFMCPRDNPFRLYGTCGKHAAVVARNQRRRSSHSFHDCDERHFFEMLRLSTSMASSVAVARHFFHHAEPCLSDLS
jgi:hypothetical protein